MGLIKAVVESGFSQIADMWQDYIYCDALDADTLVQKGHARRTAGGGTRANDNVITEGSRIAVNAGQMILQELNRAPLLNERVVCIIDDDNNK